MFAQRQSIALSSAAKAIWRRHVTAITLQSQDLIYRNLTLSGLGLRHVIPRVKWLGQILTSKAILSVGLSNDFFRFIADGTELVEVENGNAMNESKSIAIQAAMETAVVELIREGREKGYWTYWGEKK